MWCHICKRGFTNYEDFKVHIMKLHRDASDYEDDSNSDSESDDNCVAFEDYHDEDNDMISSNDSYTNMNALVNVNTDIDTNTHIDTDIKTNMSTDDCTNISTDAYTNYTNTDACTHTNTYSDTDISTNINSDISTNTKTYSKANTKTHSITNTINNSKSNINTNLKTTTKKYMKKALSKVKLTAAKKLKAKSLKRRKKKVTARPVLRRSARVHRRSSYQEDNSDDEVSHPVRKATKKNQEQTADSNSVPGNVDNNNIVLINPVLGQGLNNFVVGNQAVQQPMYFINPVVPNMESTKSFDFTSDNIMKWLHKYRELSRALKFPLSQSLFNQLKTVQKAIYDCYCLKTSGEETQAVMKVYEDLTHVVHRHISCVNETL